MKPRFDESEEEFKFGPKALMLRIRDEVSSGGEFHITGAALSYSWRNWKITFRGKTPKKGIQQMNAVLGAKGYESRRMSIPSALRHLAGKEEFMPPPPSVDAGDATTPLTVDEIRAIVDEMEPREIIGETQDEFDRGPLVIMKKIRDEIGAGAEFLISAKTLRYSWRKWKIAYQEKANIHKMKGTSKR